MNSEFQLLQYITMTLANLLNDMPAEFAGSV